MSKVIALGVAAIVVGTSVVALHSANLARRVKVDLRNPPPEARSL